MESIKPQQSTEQSKVLIYFDAIREHAPFTHIQIRPVAVVDDCIEWVPDHKADFYGVYGGKLDPETNLIIHHCIADCLTRKSAVDLAYAFNSFAKFTINIEQPKS